MSIIKNIKGAWNDFYTRPKRIKTFEFNCQNLMKSERFKKIFPTGEYNPQKKIGVTPDTLKLIFGKNGFLQEGVILNYGDFSKLAKASRAAYMALKFENIASKVSTLSDTQAVGLQKQIDEIGKLFEQLSKDTRKILSEPASKFFSCSTNAALAAAFCGGSAVAMSGLATCAIVKPFLAAGWTHWFVTCGGVMFGPSNIALLAGGAALGYAGLAIAAIALLLVAIKKVRDYVKHEKDLKILSEIESSLSEIKKSIQKLDKTFDKYGAETGKLESFLECQCSIWEKYLSNTRLKREKRAQISEKRTGNTMDLIKIMVARMITRLVLMDAKAFVAQVRSETESKINRLAKENVALMYKKNESA